MRVFVVAGLLLLSSALSQRLPADDIEPPTSLDDRLQVELFAAEPDVVTATALTVDHKGRVLVVESHTHFRPDDYAGPKTDRIRLLEDTTGDGRADRVATFYSGTVSTMNLAVHPNGWVYVATRNRIFRIRDNDDDGKADQEQTLARLETDEDYPHNGLSGFAFDPAGNVYFGMGENFGQDATLIGDTGHIYFSIGQNAGQDASVVDSEGQQIAVRRGAGGVFRCLADGSQLERVATGFWNPFHLCLDAYGRLFTGDNDPGNRPPCRFLNVVDGGDYGYRRRTLEPFISINAETPGTLPMTSSTGESPSGLLAYESDYLPRDYRGDILVTSWGENRIDRFRLTRDRASFKATTQAMIAGGDHFRPTGIAVAPDGSLYIADWADRSYPLHGKGRVWHVKRKDNASPDAPEPAEFKEGTESRQRANSLARLIVTKKITESEATTALNDVDEAIREQAVRTLPATLVDLTGIAREDKSPAVQAAALRRIADPAAEDLLLKRLEDSDPFMQQAARRGLQQSVTVSRLVELTSHERASVRLAAVLLLRGGPHFMPGEVAVSPERPSPTHRDPVIMQALQDNSPDVRFAAVEWIGRDELVQFRQPLRDGLATGATTPQLFQAYLAALAQLDGVMKHWTSSTVGNWWAKKSKSYSHVAKLLENEYCSPTVRQQALLFLPVKHPLLTVDRLQHLLQTPDAQLKLEAVRVLRSRESDTAKSLLKEIANDSSNGPNLRAEAIIGLAGIRSATTDLLQLAAHNDGVIRDEALRTLRGAVLTDGQKAELKSLATTTATTDLLQTLLKPSKAVARPNVQDLESWLNLLDGPADAEAGQRVFFHPKGPGCARCHRIDGRGRAIGPSFVRLNGRLPLTRPRLVEAILRPSKEIDPGYLPVTIVTTDGLTASGIYFKQHSTGERLIYDSKGIVRKFRKADIEELLPSTQSIMPDGLVNTMTLQEFRDLLAYLIPTASTQNEGTR